MPKISTILFGAAGLAVAWFCLQRYDLNELSGIRVTPAGQTASSNNASTDPLTTPSGRAVSMIRIATFDIQVFGKSKAAKPHVMDALARIIRNFDLVAIQQIRSADDDLLPNFVELINAADRRYDYVIGPRLGRSTIKEQYAFVFDMATIEVDRTQLYTVADPDDLLHREPLVGWFRVRGPPSAQAFTFTLVNFRADPDAPQPEIDILDDVYRAVRGDGRDEDDVIILGSLNADDGHLGELGQIPGMTAAISGVPTDTRGIAQRDNILFQHGDTNEYTGRAGVFDFMRQYNLSMDEALEISDHLPVWAEFSAYEGGQPGRVAARPNDGTR